MGFVEYLRVKTDEILGTMEVVTLAKIDRCGEGSFGQMVIKCCVN